MNRSEFQAKFPQNEDYHVEYKSAKGGIPGSLWETYSAMANTDGGQIILGVKETEGRLEIQGLENIEDSKTRFWNDVNNRNVVSMNLLKNDDVEVLEVEGKKLLLINVPRAARRQRPVYVGQNPQSGTFRRYHAGDYKCQPEVVASMWADQNEVPADAQILTGFTEKDIDKSTLQQYRNRFSAVRPEHPWLTLDTIPFLQKLGGWRQDRETREEGFTVAGILMFGTEDAILALSTQRPFNLDYRERVDESIANRWADRLTIDGTWTPNLFQFYQAVYPRLTNGIKLPFAYLDPQPTLFSDPVRAGMSPVHEAIQEALVNALIHADYSGKGGIILERFADRLELSNPGTLLISMEQLEKGAVSECRNPSLQRMFQMIGSSDKAGSGMDKIWKGWRTQQWRSPRIQEIQQPDRVLLTMPMVSLLPPDSITKLKDALGNQFDTLTADEVLALVIADTEGCVTNKRLQESTTAHHTDLTKMLQHLVSLQLLDSFGYGRWSSYKLPASITESEKFHISKKEEKTKNSPTDGENSTHNDGNSTYNGESSIHNGESSIHNGGNSIHKTDCDALTDPKLQEITREIAGKRRLDPQLMHDAIYDLCAVRALTLDEMAKLLDRNDVYLRNHFLSPMVSEGVLALKYPGTPNHPNQAYIAVPVKEKDVDDN